MGSRATISAGILAAALVAVPGAAPAAAAVSAAQDCTRDGGLLSGVTNALCDVVGTLTGTVDTLTGGTTGRVTDPVESTADELLGRVGEAVPTGRPSASDPAASRPATSRPATSRPATSRSPGATRTGPSGRREETCAGERGCAAGEPAGTPRPRPDGSAGSTGRAERSRGRPAGKASAAPAATGLGPTPAGSPLPRATGEGRRAGERLAADPDEPRVDLLWPNPFAHELTVPLQDQRVVRPTPPASDVLGTALTIALLGSAVLATRIVQQRRQRTEPVETIPFEPAPAGGGRQRLA
ncbi:hypothetical protein [Nonomuraea sp. NPDC050783]|uniref:hypothetical protein n=1 Tax=Nonomuraea sp. NPDC050783 TaxID=3154634 RepID=UPI00346563C9